jgi:hypothetical protein
MASGKHRTEDRVPPLTPEILYSTASRRPDEKMVRTGREGIKCDSYIILMKNIFSSNHVLLMMKNRTKTVNIRNVEKVDRTSLAAYICSMPHVRLI